MKAVSRRRAVKVAGAFACPACARTFLIGPDFVTELIATGRIQAGGRAEIRCGICRHVWWSKHPQALRRARSAMRAARQP